MWCEVLKGNDAKFYITPSRAGFHGKAFRTKGEAQQIADALNRAYEAGKEHLRIDLRELLDVEKAGA